MHVFIHDYIIEVSHLSLTLGPDAPLICYPTSFWIVKTFPWTNNMVKTTTMETMMQTTMKKDNENEGDEDDGDEDDSDED